MIVGKSMFFKIIGAEILGALLVILLCNIGCNVVEPDTRPKVKWIRTNVGPDLYKYTDPDTGKTYIYTYQGGMVETTE